MHLKRVRTALSRARKIIGSGGALRWVPLMVSIILYLALPGCSNFRTKQLQKRVTELEIRMSQLENETQVKTQVPNVPADLNSIPPVK